MIKILIIEDDLGIRQNLVEILELEGYEAQVKVLRDANACLSQHPPLVAVAPAQ